MNMNEFFTWEYIATFAGAMALTGLVTQFIKGFIHIPTQLLAYLVAVAVLYLGLFFTGGLTWPAAVLTLFNGILIATATSGTIDGTKRLIKNK